MFKKGYNGVTISPPNQSACDFVLSFSDVTVFGLYLYIDSNVPQYGLREIVLLCLNLSYTNGKISQVCWIFRAGQND
jgi:hypothetical protein